MWFPSFRLSSFVYGISNTYLERVSIVATEGFSCLTGSVSKPRKNNFQALGPITKPVWSKMILLKCLLSVSQGTSKSSKAFLKACRNKWLKAIWVISFIDPFPVYTESFQINSAGILKISAPIPDCSKGNFLLQEDNYWLHKSIIKNMKWVFLLVSCLVFNLSFHKVCSYTIIQTIPLHPSFIQNLPSILNISRNRIQDRLS